MPHRAIEQLLSARRVDVDNHQHLAEVCVDHAISVVKLKAVIDVFRPLSEAFEIFVTK